MYSEAQRYNTQRFVVILLAIVVLYSLFVIRNLIWTFPPVLESLDNTFAVMVFRFIFTAVVLAVFSVSILRMCPFPSEETAPLRPSISLGLCAFGGVVSLQWFLALYSAGRGGMEEDLAYPLFNIVWNGTGIVDFVLLVATLGVITPLAEELLFRGTIHRTFAAIVPRFQAVLLSSCVFAYFHSRDPQVIVAFGVGLFAALFFERTGRLMPGILLHMGLNIGFILALYGGVLGAGKVPPSVPAGAAAVLAIVGTAVFFRLPKRPDVAEAALRATIPHIAEIRDAPIPHIAEMKESAKEKSCESGTGPDKPDGR